MAEIKFTISSDNVQRIINAMKGLYPIPMVDEGTQEEPDMHPEFTESEWAKEAVRRIVIRDVSRWENKVAQELASINPDNELLS